MENKTLLNKITNFKTLLFIIFLMIIFSCNNSKSTSKISDNDTVWTTVDILPEFPGGDFALLSYIEENTVYPESAKIDSIQGKVLVRFCVTSKGNVTAVTILKGVNPKLDAEALRVIKNLPLFTPGVNAGKIVPVWYIIPITFRLK